MVGENEIDNVNDDHDDDLLSLKNALATSAIKYKEVEKNPQSSPEKKKEKVERIKSETSAEREAEDYSCILYDRDTESTYDNYTLRIPVGIMERLEETLDSLPRGMRSSKSQVVTYLLKHFLEQYQEQIIADSNAVRKALAQKENIKNKKL